MGYTHYHAHQADITPEAWRAICADVRTLLANLPKKTDTAGGYHKDDPLKLCQYTEYGESRLINGVWRQPFEHRGEPLVSDAPGEEVIQFDGAGPKTKELSNQTFTLFPHKETIEFGGVIHEEGDHTKTGRKPYDLVVAATLIVVNHHAPGCREIRSDGYIPDWIPAWRWVRETLGREYKMPRPLMDEVMDPELYVRRMLRSCEEAIAADNASTQQRQDAVEWREYIERLECAHAQVTLSESADFTGLEPTLGK